MVLSGIACYGIVCGYSIALVWLVWLVWYGKAWCGVRWFGMVWSWSNDVLCMVNRGAAVVHAEVVVLCAVVCCDVQWCTVVCCGAAVYCGVLWYSGVLWCIVVCSQVLSCAKWCSGATAHPIPWYAILSHPIQSHIISYHIISYHIISPRAGQLRCRQLLYGLAIKGHPRDYLRRPHHP